MALLLKKSPLIRTICMKHLPAIGKPTAPFVNKLQAATFIGPLKQTYGEKYPYKVLDFSNPSYSNLCQNSKVIVVEGNIAAGKNLFAQMLAKQFDLKFFRAPTDHDCFNYTYNFDERVLDEFMPEDCRTYDLKKFLQDPNPGHGRAAYLQGLFLIVKHMNYFMALRHMLYTGQGVVVVRTPYGDPVFARALHQAGFVSEAWLKYYKELHHTTSCDLLKPHLTIHLDVSMETSMDRINARKHEKELGHRNLEKLVGAMDDEYKNGAWLSEVGSFGQVMEVDWNEVGDELDIEVIAHEISNMRLQCHGCDDPLFQDWSSEWTFRKDHYPFYFEYYNNLSESMKFFEAMDPPPECPEAGFNLYQMQDGRLPILNRHQAFNQYAAKASGKEDLQLFNDGEYVF